MIELLLKTSMGEPLSYGSIERKMEMGSCQV